MVLDHFHVHQRGTHLVCQCQPVAGANERVGRRFENTTGPTGRHDDRFGLDRVHFAGLDIEGHHTAARAIFNYQPGDEPFFVNIQPHLERLFEQDLKDG